MTESDYNNHVKFGTSTWTYEGWTGTVYNRSYTKKNFKQTCLEEYAEYPYFSTVGIDHTFYGPASDDILKRYAAQLPEGFECLSKVWERITIPKYSKNKRYGKLAGEPNPDYLNADLFKDAVLPQYERSFAGHTGPFIFQFQTQYPQRAKGDDDHTDERSLGEIFTEELDRFLGSVPADFRYSVEVRNREFLTPDYFDMLRSHNVSHVFNHWTNMPSIGEQRYLSGSITADHIIARILTPLGLAYKQAVDSFFPYNEVKKPIQSMRKDVAQLAIEAVDLKKKAYAIVNNRAEGNAPGTIEAIDAMIRGQIG